MNIGNQSFQILTPEQANPAVSSLQRVIHQHLQNMNTQARTQHYGLLNKQIQAKLPYIAPEEAQKLQGLNLSNKKAAALLPFVAPQAAASLLQTQQSGLATSLANEITKLTMPDTVQRAGLQNQELAAQIHNILSGNVGVGARNVNQQLYSQALDQVGQDNPGLQGDAQRERDALNAIASGKRSLPDGTILNDPSPVLQNKIGAWAKSSTTAPLITQQVRGQQAEAEIPVLSNIINKYTAPYGDTYFGKSPQQIMDSFSSDADSQKRLGQFAGAQALQYEQAQIRNKLAGAQPSEYATKELLGSGNQLIDSWYPKMSEAARQESSKVINEGLDAAFKARKSVGINAAQTLPGYTDSSSSSYGDSSNGDYSSSVPAVEDPRVAIAMKKYGISRDDALASLGS